MAAAFLQAAAELGDAERVRSLIGDLLIDLGGQEGQVAAHILLGTAPWKCAVTVSFTEKRGRRPREPRRVRTSQGLVTRFDIAAHCFRRLGAPQFGQNPTRSVKQAKGETAAAFGISERTVRDCLERYGNAVEAVFHGRLLRKATS